MNYKEEYEQEIDLKDLLFAILYKWKLILVVAVVLAVALGGYKGYSTYQKQSNTEVLQEAETRYQAELETYTAKKEAYDHEISGIKNDIAEQQEYLSQSALMNLSAYNLGEAKVDLFVSVAQGTAMDSVLKSYKSTLESVQFLENVAKQAGMEARYLKELVTITVGNNMVSVQVRHKDAEAAQKVLDEILKEVNTYAQRINGVIGSHTLTPTNESKGMIVDSKLADTQKVANDRLRSFNEKLDARQKEVAALKAPTEPVASNGDAVKDGVKFAVVGGVLGAFAVVFGVCVVFLMNGKIYSANELRNRFRVQILGTLPPEKRVRGINGWLRRLEGRAQGPAEYEYVLAAANIQNYAESAKRILVTGTAPDAKIGQVAERLAGELADFELVSGGNLLRDAETLRKLPQVDAVVLVEQCNVSSYEKIERALEKAASLEKKVLGCIVLE